jgi:hypothetical protein
VPAGLIFLGSRRPDLCPAPWLLQLPCQKKWTRFGVPKKCGFHWRNSLLEAVKPWLSGFVRFPTKPETVSQKSPDPPTTTRVCVVFAACQGRFQVGTVIADRERINASFASDFLTTTKDSS